MIAVLWHWWIAPALVLGTILVLVVTVAGYLMKVTAPKYAKKPKK